MSKAYSQIMIQIPDEIIKGIEQKLNGIKKPESVVKTVVNNTAKRVQKILVNKASKEYTGEVAEKSKIMAASSIRKATVKSQMATIRFISPVHEIKDFHISSLDISKTYYEEDGKRGKKELRGGVLEGSSKVLDNAFVVQFKSGHIAAVTRIPGTHMKSNPKKEKLRKILSPSYKVMIGGKHVYGESSDQIGIIIHNEAEKVLKKILGGK